MSHDPHETLPAYSAAQVLHDGCAECAGRAKSRDLGIGALDAQAFTRAWKRASDWNHDQVWDISQAEVPLLSVLWAVQVQLERRGVPVGEVPYGLR